MSVAFAACGDIIGSPGLGDESATGAGDDDAAQARRDPREAARRRLGGAPRAHRRPRRRCRGGLGVPCGEREPSET